MKSNQLLKAQDGEELNFRVVNTPRGLKGPKPDASTFTTFMFNTTKKKVGDWLSNWLDDPETKRKLQQNLQQYGYLLTTAPAEGMYQSFSPNVERQLNTQKENLDWAINNVRIYDHDNEKYKGKSIMGIYDYNSDSNGGRDIWISPRNIVLNKYIANKRWDDSDVREYGNPTMENLLTEEMTHASEPTIQEIAAEQILKKHGGYNVSEFNKDYLHEGPELYASLQRLRRLTGLQPGQKIDAAWIKAHQKEITESRLEKMEPETLIEMNNVIAMNRNNNNSLVGMAKCGMKINYLDLFKQK